MKECIAAIATALAPAGIGVVRLSGKGAIDIASKFFKSSKDLCCLKGYEAAYGNIFDGDFILDDGVALVFKSPNSYTGEDVVEISCHGGVLILEKLLDICLRNGAKAATNGEFTKRAFLNGKLSLTQAESVMDVINADSVAFLRAATGIKNGLLYKKTKEVADKLVELAGHIAVWLDYPGEDIEDVDIKKFKEDINCQILKLDDILKNSKFESFLKDGVKVVLVGKPNVGKSTIMNLLCEQEKSIVTEISGTTRDVIECKIDINGVDFFIYDTAGITHTSDVVEKIGVEKAKQKIKVCDVILFVTDNLTQKEDLAILDEYNTQKKIFIYNKTDLKYQKEVFSNYNFDMFLDVSNKDMSSIKKLKDAIFNLQKLSDIDYKNMPAILNSRQKDIITYAFSNLKYILKCLEDGCGIDAVGVLLEDVIKELLKLNGEDVTDAILKEIFSKFCVGK